MSTIIAGLFSDSKKAGEAVSRLKEKGYTDNVSIVAKGVDGQISTEEIKGSSGAAGALAGAAVGGPVGALVGLIAGAVSVAIPGAMLLVAGPLAVTWGVTGAALGALSGGLVGALVDAGFSEEKAKIFEDHIMRGEVLVAVTGDDDRTDAMADIMHELEATEVVQVPQAK